MSKNQIIVKWFAWNVVERTGLNSPDDLSLGYLDALIYEPEPLHKFLSQIRDKNHNMHHFLKCYALMDFCKNAFVIRAPLDLTINIDRQNKNATINGISGYGQVFCDTHVLMRWNETSSSDRLTFSIFPKYVFYADKSVMVESLPMILEPPDNMMLLPGRFNIGKWVRPLDFSCEVVDDAKPLTFKRGDPLFIVRFSTDNNEPIELERVERTERHVRLACTLANIKAGVPFTPLHKLYELAKPLLQLFNKNC